VIEVEIKAYLDDLSFVESQLLQLGAIFQKTIHQSDIYLQHPIRNFAQTDEAVRIRISDNGNFLTYKGPKIDSSSKTREELEIEIREPDKLLELLKKIGFFPIKTVNKVRTLYLVEDITVSLDKVEGLGSFIELEIDVADQEAIPSIKNRLFSFFAQLKIPSQKLERRSYLELLLLSKTKNRDIK
jgi:adenylate cyclase class 2